MKLIARILILPFYGAFTLCHFLFMWFYHCRLFILYGGEVIVYQNRMANRKINEVYNLVQKLVEQQK